MKRLLPEFLDEIAEVEGQVAELDGTIKAATAKEDDEEEDARATTRRPCPRTRSRR